MTIVIKDTTIVTGDAGRTILYNASIAIEDDRIVGVGPTAEIASRYPDSETVGGRGKAVFPGLINAHTHLLATANRGIMEDFGFPTTLRFPIDVRMLMSQEEANVMALLGALEAIRSGTTCLLEISSDIPTYAPSLDKTGLRLVLAEYIEDLDEAKAREGVYEYSEERLDAGLQKSAELIEGWNGRSDGRVICFMSPATPEACSPQALRRSREMAEHYDIGYTIHLSESYLEIEAVKRVRGVLPTHYLFANDFLGPRLLTAHCRYLDDSEVALLGQKSTSVSYNPAIAARRGAVAKVKELQAAGCAIGMGSDNMAEDMVEVMRAGLFLERVRRNAQMDPQPEDALEWATRGSARALGLEGQVGTLEVGKKADLFMIDTMRPHLVPTLRIVSAFVHNGYPADITSVMVDGQWLMRDGKVLTIDEPDILRRGEEIGHSLWHRLLKRYPNVPFPIALPPHG